MKEEKKLKNWIALALVVAVLFLAITPIWFLPYFFVSGISNDPDISNIEKFGALSDARKFVAQVCGGLLAALGIFAAVWRSYALDRQASIMEQGQITERFTRAINQLGALDNNGNPVLEIRLGAIYALERIAKESADDHWPIMEVLTAYVRENAPKKTEAEKAKEKEVKLPRKDIQAILTVIGRRPRREEEKQNEGQIIDLSGTDLRNATLKEPHWTNANFNDADVTGYGICDELCDSLESQELNRPFYKEEQAAKKKN